MNFPSLLRFAFVAFATVGSLAAADAPPDYRFKPETLATGLVQPMELEVAPDGRIFFNEISGKLRVWKPGSSQIVEAGEVPVFTGQENGFLGFALDPQFAQNHWIYLYYSPTNHTGQRLSRFVMDGDRLVPTSETVVLEFPEQRKDCCHHAGSVEFAPDGNLFISTGDNTHPAGDSDGYAPIDERPGREEYDAQDAPANTADLRGKILRIRPTAAGGYTIPDGNLFPKDGSQGRPEIYVMGCRNPWRLSVDSRTGYIYWGEVGPDAGGDGPRGSRGYDEINQAKAPGNFGWPYFVGPNAPYARYDFATRTLGPKFDPARPENLGRNNTGAKILPPAQPAFIYWPYGDSREFPMLGSGGRTACAGPVFHYRPEFAQTGGFPEHYDNCLLFYDWQRPFVKWARLNPQSDLVGIEPFPGVTLANDRGRVAAAEQRGEFVIRRVVDSQFGTDGCLYLLDYGETWGVNPDAKLIKISYQRGNLAPVARGTVTPSAGREPLTLTLSAAGSIDRDGDALTYDWRLQPGDRSLATTAEAQVTLTEPGNFVLELRVTDPSGARGTTQIPLVVGNSLPVVRFLSPQSGDFFTPGKPVEYEVRVQDLEDGDSNSAEEIMEAQVYVSAKWGRGDGREPADEPGLALMKQSDCFNCHALETKIVGPPLLEVANRYRGQPGALDASVKRVLQGSSKVWGELPMLPHPNLTPDQAQLMVRWVYALEAGKLGANFTRGLRGSVSGPKEGASNGWLEAAYTDQGRAPAGSLAGRTTLQLRPRRLEAEQAGAIRGAKVLGGYLGAIEHGGVVELGSLNLADARSVTVRVASAGAGGAVEVRQGSATGPVVAEFAVQPTGGWETWKELTAPLPKGTRDNVFIVFRNPGQGGLMNLDWIQFNAE
ncbi:MAG: PQQ-dependent sugar dehydrogenase [Verrucomicrobia bacterium]|nr:PQQ-dependent sugar dehydrogenase [Verrucomicrobiota bacterium]